MVGTASNLGSDTETILVSFHELGFLHLLTRFLGRRDGFLVFLDILMAAGNETGCWVPNDDSSFRHLGFAEKIACDMIRKIMPKLKANKQEFRGIGDHDDGRQGGKMEGEGLQ